MGRQRKVGQDKLLPRQHCLTPPLAPIFSERRRQTMPNFKAGILPELIHLVVVRGRRSFIAVLRLARRGSVRTSI